jgi:phosphoglycerate dehydrogenase-like enzyme
MVTLVVLTDENRPPGMAVVEDQVEVTYVTAAGLPEALPGAEILFVWDFLSDAVAGAWPKADALRWVHIAAAGVDNLMFPELVDSPVVLTNSRGIFDQPMAEYVLGLVLSFAKDLFTTVRLQQRRRWQHRETERIAGRSALVVGTGPIGRAIGRQLRAAGMLVSGVGRTERPADPDLGRVWPMRQLPAALATADYVVLAAPTTRQTTGMIDAAALAAMRPGARLINVGRGALVVEPDLIEALRAGRIAGAALDVFADEPLPDSSPLWDMPGVLVSPHMSGDVVGWRDELAELFVDNFTRYRQNRPLRNVVDKQLGYVR